MSKIVNEALERTEICFEKVKLAPYKQEGKTFFNHLHSDQYATFLYFVSNSAFKRGEIELASRTYCLNKALNGIMVTYDTKLPDIFLIIHTVGMMLGKAKYSNYFVGVHNMTIGTDRGVSPELDEGVVVWGGAAVLGKSKIGRCVNVAAGCRVLNQDVPSDHVVAGISPNLTIKSRSRNVLTEMFFDI